MPEVKRGPLTRQEITALWVGVTDPGYHQPFLENPEDSGFEAIEQAHEQFARASVMVDRVTQAMFICPWSGQTDEPASGGRVAKGDLSVARSSSDTKLPVVLQKGLVILHVVDDFGKDGAVEVVTGRRYLLSETTTVGSGERGPILAPYESEREGAAYNLPLPDTLIRIEQLGRTFGNDNAELIAGNVLRMPADPDVVTPRQIGQYLEIADGPAPSPGQRRRIVDVRSGSSPEAILDTVGLYSVTAIAGTFAKNEQLEVLGSAIATFRSLGNGKLAAELLGTALTIGPGDVLVGAMSGATATVVAVELDPVLPTGPLVTWRILGWEDDLGISVTNEESPSDGRSPWLDELGAERNVDRSAGEADDDYRKRVKEPADVVSPNAIVRTINRILLPLGCQGCFYEHGNGIQGFFYDAGSSDDAPQDPDRNFAYDVDPSLRPQDATKLYFDFLEMRAFFMVGVCRLGGGDFGFAYDDDDRGFYDRVDGVGFYDGYPVEAAAAYTALHDELERVKAGGVGFVLFIDDVGCDSACP